MDPRSAADRLEANARAFSALLSAVPDAQLRWRPAPGRWSMLEVLNHLGDEELEDFRMRLDLTLHAPGEAWPPIDPEGWVASRGYAERDPAESLERFLGERARSVTWLRALDAPDWERACERPFAGPPRAGDLLASWLEHDLLHLRQLLRLHHAYLVETSRPYDVAYAGGGDW